MASKKERLQSAGAGLDKLFSEASQGAQEAPKKSGRRNTQSKDKKGSEEPTKRQTKVFSFRGDLEDVTAWRLYASIKGLKVDQIGSEAMRDYIKKHPLKGAELELFNARMEEENQRA